MNISISPKALANVFQNHAMELPIHTGQGHKLADKLGNLVNKTDIQTIAMIYTYFLWIYVYDWGKTLNKSQDNDKLRQLRVEYGLNNFNLVERNGYYTLAPIDYKKYNDYLRNKSF